METNVLLQLKNINVHYDGVTALDGVSLVVNKNEIVAIMGPNGAGKSTILKAIFGLVHMTSGKMVYSGRNIKSTPNKLVERGISFVPQGRRVFPHLTVLENIEIGGHFIKAKGVFQERVRDALELFPVLKEKMYQRAGQLSGGQQQMVAFARGLVSNPKLLLLDEPSLGLAPKVVKEVFAQIKDINEKRNTAIVVVEHNISSLLEIADRVYVLNKGRIVREDNARNMDESDVLEEFFLAKK